MNTVNLDLNINGHSFKFIGSDGKFLNYICSVCNMRGFYYDNADSNHYYIHVWADWCSCDEYLLKSILE